MFRTPARHLRQTLAFTLSALALAVLPLGCGKVAKPSPIDSALNAPEGSQPKAPPEPAPLMPPPNPPEPSGNHRP